MDLKPDNIVLNDDCLNDNGFPGITIIDFGSSIVLSSKMGQEELSDDFTGNLCFASI